MGSIFNVERDEHGRWGVYLDHQCREWDIAGETAFGGTTGVDRAEAVALLEAFLEDGRRALEALRGGRGYGHGAAGEPVPPDPSGWHNWRGGNGGPGPAELWAVQEQMKRGPLL